MVLLNWRSRSQRIHDVVVPARAVADGSYPLELMMAVSAFVNHALGSAMYLRDELPREALIADNLADYLGAVNNGGHVQFVGDMWCDEFRADIRDGLAILGLDDAGRIFADLEAFSEAEPDRFASWDGQGREIDPFFEELDLRFYGSVAESIEAATTTWLETRPWLRVMADADYARIEGWKTPDHPLRNARVEVRRRRNASVWKRFLLSLRSALSSDDRSTR